MLRSSTVRASDEPDFYGDTTVLVSTWSAISLMSLGYSTISILRLAERPSSVSFEATGCVSA